MEDFVKNRGKTGLVLEGGAMRGLFTAGVLDIFMENNVLVDGVAAVDLAVVGVGVGHHWKELVVEAIDDYRVVEGHFKETVAEVEQL